MLSSSYMSFLCFCLLARCHSCDPVFFLPRYAKYSIELKEGYECCSPEAVTFHYVKPDLMPRMQALLYDCRAAAA